ncbi:hypothetical protein L7F22_069045 [Adiantum nelumboides]|nr:hypothetical protein [Adiantum nelumboides]MCO5614761.1 hypothetical protein [Adiantum nelumboides]
MVDQQGQQGVHFDANTMQIFQAFALFMQQQQAAKRREVSTTNALHSIVNKMDQFKGKDFSKYLHQYEKEMELNRVPTAPNMLARAVFIATVECVWLRRLMADLGVGQDTANTIYTYSRSALIVAKNPVFHACTKHIKVHYHYVRERLLAGEISLAYVPTQDNLTDLFTKALSREKLEAFRKALGLLPFVD